VFAVQPIIQKQYGVCASRNTMRNGPAAHQIDQFGAVLRRKRGVANHASNPSRL
jgi:hypothetical protein